MKNRKTLGDILSGKNREIIPNIAFHIMTAMMKLMDFFGKHSSKNFKTLDLKPGQTVIDYGCGPARYIQNASNTVGESGKVIAVDIHPLAIKKIQKKIDKYKLTNVETVLAEGYHTTIDSETADVIYALDMFHMIKQPKKLLVELSRLLKRDGTLIIEDGHQSRSETIQKIEKAGVLKILQETKFHVKCKKII
ncbi:MAG: methyltransferase domain-containing protein [Deltaproteobacteria bacterium]|nr:methyltransferase domain-containing protein [Deltaproteobacteria bacterium]